MVGLLEEKSYQEVRLTVAVCSQAQPGILAIDSLERFAFGLQTERIPEELMTDDTWSWS